jgi:hypothetical protein
VLARNLFDAAPAARQDDRPGHGESFRGDQSTTHHHSRGPLTMARHTILLKLLGTACLALWLTSSAANAADPNGTWTWTFSRGGQEIELSLDLKQEGEKLTGTLTVPFGGGLEIDISDGSFKDDEVSFKTVFERDGNSFETKYQGKIDGDTIKGTTERERNGEVRSRDWEAKRKK